MGVLFIFLFYTTLISFWIWFWSLVMSTGLQFYITILVILMVNLIGLSFTNMLNDLGYNKKSIFLHNITNITTNVCILALLIDTLLIQTDYFFKGIKDYLVIYAWISTVLSIVIVLLYSITLNLCKKTNILAYNILLTMSFWIYLTLEITSYCFSVLCVGIPLSYIYLFIYCFTTPNCSYINAITWYINVKRVLKIYFLTNIIANIMQFLFIYMEIYMEIYCDTLSFFRLYNIVNSTLVSVTSVLYFLKIKNKRLIYLIWLIEYHFIFNFIYYILLLTLVSFLYLATTPIWYVEEFSILLMLILVWFIIIVDRICNYFF